MDNQLRIIYLGTPGFAVPPLKRLAEAGYHIVAVVTAPDRPAGRGLKMQASPVKEYAQSRGIPVLQPEKLKDPQFLEALRSYRADLQIVVAFRMLPEVVWNMPPMGTFNLHASMLPHYRGAAPINRAIMEGEKETGLTTFFLQHKIDTGDLLLQKKMNIGPHETAGELHDRMSEEGAELVLRTVQELEAGRLAPRPQEAEGTLKEAPKIFKEDCRINWEQRSSAIYDFIRGLSPYPAAWTTLDGKVFKIYKGTAESGEAGADAAPGTIFTDGKSYLKVATTDGYILLEEVQLEGKKKMQVEDFLRGYSPEASSFA